MRGVELTFDLAGATRHLRHQWTRFRRQAVSERGADLVRATLAPLGAERTLVTLDIEPDAAQILSADAARSMLDEVRGSFLDFLEDEGFRAADERPRSAGTEAKPIAARPEDFLRVGPYPALAAFALIAVMVMPMWQEARERAAAKAPVPEAVRRSALHDGGAAEGLMRLAAAISATRSGRPWPDRARRLEDAAARLSPSGRAALARAVFIEAAAWIGEGAEASIREELTAAARAVDSRVPLSEQGEAVERYFDAAARAMSSPARPGADSAAKWSVRVG